MTEHFPDDEFDNLPRNNGRVGAHRSKHTHITFWKVAVGWVLSVALIIGIGFLALQAIKAGNSFSQDGLPSASASATPRNVNRATAITLLDASGDATYASSARTTLKGAGWKTITAVAADQTVKKTIVYYVGAANKGSAQQVADDLGITSVASTTAYQQPLTVVLGSDLAAASATPSKSASSSAAAGSASPAASPDASLRVVVWNGTSTIGLAGKTRTTLVSNGWTVASVADAPSRTTTTTVIYRDSSAKSQAALLAKQLGTVSIKNDASYSAALTVILGSDFNG